ncbi:hypothetical protein Tco_0173419 [Tanacetum coccineum]
MIQPEPEDLPKDNPKLEIAVLRRKPRFNSSDVRITRMIADIENDIMEPVMPMHKPFSCHSRVSLTETVSFVTEIQQGSQAVNSRVLRNIIVIFARTSE